MTDISIIVPVLNEESSIQLFLDKVSPILSAVAVSYEIIFVDDGSTDTTAHVIANAQKADARIKLLQFSRNFGKEAALTAGMDWACGEAVIPMDVDLQDPPELISEFIRLWREGYDIVFGQRVARNSDTATKQMTAGLFYNIFNKLSSRPIDINAGDYRLMSRTVVDATLQLRERNRFMKGLFAWVGYNSIAVPYERPPRAAGDTKFNYWKLWNFALDGITSFSTVPLKIWTYLGLGVALIAVAYTIIIVARTLLLGVVVPGYASLMVVVLLLGAVQLISLGVMGEYIGRLYLETKQRPIYLLRKTVGFKKGRETSKLSSAQDVQLSDQKSDTSAISAQVP